MFSCLFMFSLRPNFFLAWGLLMYCNVYGLQPFLSNLYADGSLFSLHGQFDEDHEEACSALSFEISLWLLMGFGCQLVFHAVIDNWGFSYILMRIEDFENTAMFESS